MHLRIEYTLQSENIVISGYRDALLIVDYIVIILIEKPVIILSQVEGISGTVLGNTVIGCIAADKSAAFVGSHQSAVEVLYNGIRRGIIGKLRIKALWISEKRSIVHMVKTASSVGISA